MNLPNLITLSRVPMLFVVAGLLYADTAWTSTAAFGLFIFGGITDWLDGYLARRYRQVSNFGKLMDALTDKVFIGGLFVTLLVPLRHGESVLPGWALFFVLLILAREFLVTGLRLIAASRGIVLAAERSGKIKTVLQIVCIAVLLLAQALEADFKLDASSVAPVHWTGLALFLAAAALTTASGTGYITKYRHLLADAPPPSQP